MNDFYVYAHLRKDTGRVFYVGKGRRRRAWSSLGRNDDWKAVDAASGFDVKMIAEGLDEDQAFSIEIKSIAILSRICQLTNRSRGGKGGCFTGYKHSDQIKAIISDVQKGRKKSDEHKEKLRQANLGKKLSTETVAKMMAARTGNGLEGSTKSESHKKALSSGVIGKAKATNSSGYPGVYYHKGGKKWAASITVDRKAIYLGLHNTPEEAHAAYLTKLNEVLEERKADNGYQSIPTVPTCVWGEAHHLHTVR